MTRAHDQYYDEDRRRWPYTDPDDSMSIQDLAVMRGHDAPDEDLHDYDEETYNEYLMDTGDF